MIIVLRFCDLLVPTDFGRHVKLDWEYSNTLQNVRARVILAKYNVAISFILYALVLWCLTPLYFICTCYLFLYGEQ